MDLADADADTGVAVAVAAKVFDVIPLLVGNYHFPEEVLEVAVGCTLGFAFDSWEVRHMGVAVDFGPLT